MAKKKTGRTAPKAKSLRQEAKGIKRAYLKNYKEKDRFPLEGYLALLCLYSALFAGFYTLVRRRGDKVPERFDLRDIVLLGIAAHRVSRHATKDLVTSVLRSPFTEFAESTGESEVYEHSRGKGLTYAFADLITCPWCFSGWTSMFMGFGLALKPRFTRMAASIFTIEAISDFMHVSYDILRKVKRS